MHQQYVLLSHVRISLVFLCTRIFQKDLSASTNRHVIYAAKTLTGLQEHFPPSNAQMDFLAHICVFCCIVPWGQLWSLVPFVSVRRIPALGMRDQLALTHR